MQADTTMPPITRTAFQIFIAAFLFYPVISYFEPTGLPPIPPEAMPTFVLALLVFVVPFFGAGAFVVYKAYRGRNWAQTTHQPS